LIADEPTTGLDVTTQKAVMDLVVELTQQRGMSTILITHDLGLAAAYCDRVVVMEKGHIVETADSDAIFKEPAHPYTHKLMRATPRLGVSLRELLPEDQGERAKAAPPAKETVSRDALLFVENLVKEYPRQGRGPVLGRLFGKRPLPEIENFRAVDGITFSIARGESVGLVGDSLNPRFTAARAIADPLLRLAEMPRRQLRGCCEELAQQVGLPLELLDRFPHQLSGGQKARVGIARAIALKPDLIILDEPTAALDVSVQAIVLNLLQDLKDSLGISYLFVSHDLNVVRLLCNRVIVMHAGKIVEEGPTKRVLAEPQAEYTRNLLAAIPHPPL
jgi:peptide/nickel transport system ATP-binding protein